MLIYSISDELEIFGYVDSNFAGSTDEMKSTSGYVFKMAGGVISWKEVKKTSTAFSTVQAEFITCYEPTIQAVWRKNFVQGWTPIPLNFIMTMPKLYFTPKSNRSSGSKHNEIKYVVRDKIKEGQTNIEHINTDPMTKHLDPHYLTSM